MAASGSGSRAPKPKAEENTWEQKPQRLLKPRTFDGFRVLGLGGGGFSLVAAGCKKLRFRAHVNFSGVGYA